MRDWMTVVVRAGDAGRAAAPTVMTTPLFGEYSPPLPEGYGSTGTVATVPRGAVARRRGRLHGHTPAARRGARPPAPCRAAPEGAQAASLRVRGRHLAQLLLQVRDLVTQAGGQLELELFRGAVHLLR